MNSARPLLSTTPESRSPSLTSLADKPMERDNIVELLRFTACAVVVICHFFAAFLPRSIFGVNCPNVAETGYHSGSNLLKYGFFDLMTAGNFAVALFFVLSGYVLAKPTFQKLELNWASLGGDILKRYVRLAVPLYFYCVVSYLCFKFSVYEHTGLAASASSGSTWLRELLLRSEIDKTMLYITANPFQFSSELLAPAWTISAELIGSFISFLLAAIIHSSTGGLIIGAAVFIFVPGYFKLFVAGTMFAYCEKVGIFTKLRERARYRFPVFGAVAASIFCLYVNAFPWYVQAAEIKNLAPSFLPALVLNQWLCNAGIAGGITSLGAVLTFFFTKLFATETELLRRIAWLGKHTYTIYLSHFMLIATITSFVYIKMLQPHYFHYATTLVWSFLTLTTSLCITCGLLTRLVDGQAIELARQLKLWYVRTLS